MLLLQELRTEGARLDLEKEGVLRRYLPQVEERLAACVSRVDGMVSPLRMMWTTEVGSLALTTGLPASFAKALRGPDTLLLMAAHRERTSFGCGNDSVATFFGRAWLVEGLNATTDFDAAFVQATAAIEARELAEGLEPSRPQINRGARIGERLAAWRAGFEPGPALPYPFALDPPTEGNTKAEVLTPLLPPGDKTPKP